MAYSCLFGIARFLGVFVILCLGFVSVLFVLFLFCCWIVFGVVFFFFCVCFFSVLFFCLFCLCFCGGCKGQVRWPKGPPHLALNPPYFCVFWGASPFFPLSFFVSLSLSLSCYLLMFLVRAFCFCFVCFLFQDVVLFCFFACCLVWFRIIICDLCLFCILFSCCCCFCFCCFGIFVICFSLLVTYQKNISQKFGNCKK